ncbi:hypothetical protein BCR35DRAFT_329807 [Leucosporidium creatinivorum]|uniref:Uncharacterized protein n=1 Tax=Leucosporidium creatinivorum TaxID=106004 RepID=A0A1Y2FWZ0_9BASI|nr:hypothetical protein BCR35DRAFT_329807 [Leucosporidium creatinivorum]
MATGTKFSSLGRSNSTGDRLRAQKLAQNLTLPPAPASSRPRPPIPDHSGYSLYSSASRPSSRASLVRAEYRSPPQGGGKGSPANGAGAGIKSRPSLFAPSPSQEVQRRSNHYDLPLDATAALRPSSQSRVPRSASISRASSFAERPSHPSFSTSSHSAHSSSAHNSHSPYPQHPQHPRSPSSTCSPSQARGRTSLPSLASLHPRSTMPPSISPAASPTLPQLPPIRSRSPSLSRPPSTASTSSALLGGPGPRPSERDFGAQYGPRPSERDFGAQYSLGSSGGSSIGRRYITMKEYTTQSGAASGGRPGWGGLGAREAEQDEDEVMGSWGTGSEERVERKTPIGWR